MAPDFKARAERAERSGYLPALRDLVMRHAAPFFWCGRASESDPLQVRHNGTVTFVNTGSKVIGITADHVLAGYNRERQLDLIDFEAQWGGATVLPERQVIDRNGDLDLATFEAPQVLLNQVNAYPHTCREWPPAPARKGDLVVFGGFSGSLRTEGPGRLDSPFQCFAGRVHDATPERVSVHLDPDSIYWPGRPNETINSDLGGCSGGPVFRVVSEPVEYLELLGIVYEHSSAFGLHFFRPVSLIQPDGSISVEYNPFQPNRRPNGR